MKKKTLILIIIALTIIVSVGSGITFAHWGKVKTQNDSNNVDLSCLDISFANESSAINMPYAYPISDWTGMNLTPYTFTVVNNCERDIDYRIDLESLKVSNNRIPANLVDIIFDYGIFTNYSELDTVTSTNNDAIERRTIAYDTILGSEDIEKPTTNTHYLRIWIDEDASNQSGDANYLTPNSSFAGNIVITAGQGVKKYYTPEECFEYGTPTNGTVSIKGFANGYDKSLCGTDLVLPYEITDSNSGEKYTVTSIFNGSFQNTSATLAYDVTSVEIPRTVEKIGGNVFKGQNINRVIMKDGLTEFLTGFCSGAAANAIADLDFYMIPSTVTKTGGTKFTNLKNIIIPDNVTSLFGTSNFQFNKIENFSIGTGLTTIPNAAFAANEIENIVIPGNVKKINTGAFAGNPIKSITLNEGIEEIGPACFNNSNNTFTLGSPYTYTYNSYHVDIPITIINISKELDIEAFYFSPTNPGIINFVGRTSIPISTNWYRNATVLCNGTTCTN